MFTLEDMSIAHARFTCWPVILSLPNYQLQMDHGGLLPLWIMDGYPLVILDSHWKWRFVVDCPIKHGDFPQLCLIARGKKKSDKPITIGYVAWDLRVSLTISATWIQHDVSMMVSLRGLELASALKETPQTNLWLSVGFMFDA